MVQFSAFFFLLMKKQMNRINVWYQLRLRLGVATRYSWLEITSKSLCNDACLFRLVLMLALVS